jgi:hypothetical protein
MTQKRWKQVEAVFEQALELPVGERANFVQTTCDGDEELAREVQSLLDSHTRAGSFIDRPRVFLAGSEIDGDGATIASGQVIGAYWVVRELGRGGMGVDGPSAPTGNSRNKSRSSSSSAAWTPTR